MYRGGDLSTKGRDLSTEGETRQLSGGLVYGVGGSSTEGVTRLHRARLFCGGTDSYTEGETSLWRGRLVYRGGNSYTEGETRLEARLGTILDAIGNVQNGLNTVSAEYIHIVEDRKMMCTQGLRDYNYN